MHIFDFRWHDNQYPFFQVIKENHLEEKNLEIGKPFSIKVEEKEKICSGSYNNGVYSPCPNNEKGVKKCEICKKADDYFPCQYCNGFNCDRFRDVKIENCDSEHMVYLALFTPDIIKVGVSKLSRGKTRQFEQGSHFTRIFAEKCSGIQARRIESFLTKCGFPDKIPASQKKGFLFPAISLDEGRKLLEEKFQLAKEHVLSHTPEINKYILKEEKIWDIRTIYSKDFEKITNSQKPVHFIELQKGESVSGV